MTIASARAESKAIGRQLQSAGRPTDRLPVVVQNFNEHFIGSKATTMFMSMLVAVSCVLLIACANVANLMLARAIGRSRDISLRIALGAERQRIIRQLLTESLLLAGVAAVLGWGLAKLGVRAYELTGHAPFNYKHYVDFGMDVEVFGYMVAISVATGLLFGLAPAIRLSRLDLNSVLKDSGRGTAGSKKGQWASTCLVIGEMALAVVLLVGAGIMIRSYLNIYAVDVGIDTERVLVSDLGLPRILYGTPESQVAFHDRLAERLSAVPGVEAITIADRYPTQGTRQLGYEVDGVPAADEEHRPAVRTMRIGVNYFRTMGTAVYSGREFTAADAAGGMPVVVVNQQFADHHWTGETAVGKQVRLFGGNQPGDWLTVVGVVSNIVQHDVARDEPNAVVYVPFRQDPDGFMYVFARSRVPPATLKTAFDDQLQALDPELTASFVTVGDRMDRQYRDRGLFGALLTIFAAVGSDAWFRRAVRCASTRSLRSDTNS